MDTSNFDINVQKLKNIIKTNNNFAIFMHENPDGDTIGSGLGFGYFLESLGKKVGYFCPSDISRKFFYLDKIKDIKKDFDFDESRDILIFVDNGSPTKQISPFWEKNKQYFLSKFKVVIDHHIINDGIGDLIIREKVSSTCFLVGKILNKLNFKIDKNISNFLLLGHLTDTNFCMRPSSDKEDMLFAVKLLEEGGNKQDIVDNIYYNSTFSSIKLIGKIIERAKLENGIIWSFYTDYDLKKFGAEKEDVDLVMDLLRKAVEGKIYLLFRKFDDILKVSIRTKQPIAAKIAKLFGGGGHLYASGFKKVIKKSLDKEIIDIIDFIKDKF